ncbi:MAG: DUF5810 domain-containing protein [Haloarculaceae archaeon]
MGYACPVCGDPQADAGHLANHLAITAIARGGDHEAWLEEHVPDWTDRGEDTLATALSEQASEADYPQIFEDTTGEDGSDPDPDHSGWRHHRRGASGGALEGDLPVDVPDQGLATDHTDGDFDAATREAIRRAREMTEEATSDGDTDSGEAQTTADESETE